MNRFWILAVALALLSCEKDKDLDQGTNSILLLRVDYQTYTFEGGYEMTMNGRLTPYDTLPIQVFYQSPGDFGNITLCYQPTMDTIFDGGIIWMGRGDIHHPRSFRHPMNYGRRGHHMPMPDTTRFQRIFHQWNTHHQMIWNSIDDLAIVSEYAQSHKKIGLFLYTPSVGIGDPADWDWFIIMNK